MLISNDRLEVMILEGRRNRNGQRDRKIRNTQKTQNIQNIQSIQNNQKTPITLNFRVIGVSETMYFQL